MRFLLVSNERSIIFCKMLTASLMKVLFISGRRLVVRVKISQLDSQQDVFILLVPCCLEQVVNWYHLITRSMRPTDS